MYYPREVELLLRLSGLTVRERFGDYDQTPFTARSKQYVWTMTTG